MSEWPEANQRYLMAAVGVVRVALESYVARGETTALEGVASRDRAQAARRALEDAERELPPQRMPRLTPLWPMAPSMGCATAASCKRAAWSACAAPASPMTGSTTSSA